MSAHHENGRQWAERVYREKLANPRSLPNLGPGYSVELRAIRAVLAIASNKMYVRTKGRVQEIRLPREQREFWLGVLERGGEISARVGGPLGAVGDDFDFLFEEQSKPAKARPAALEVLDQIRRGSLVRVGRGPVWHVFRSNGPMSHYVTRAGTKGRKAYEIVVVDPQNYDAAVFEIDGSANRGSQVVAPGRVEVTGWEERA